MVWEGGVEAHFPVFEVVIDVKHGLGGGGCVSHVVVVVVVVDCLGTECG